MMKTRGKCMQCGRETLLANVTRQLCGDCNYKRLHGGQSRYAVARARQPKKQKRRSTGELAVFREIWTERPHVCNRCGRPLGEELKVSYFSHIKSKGARPDLRLDKNNIELLCTACHREYEFGIRNNERGM